MTQKFERKPHPERCPNEVFLANFDENGFHVISWNTKRRGQTAYDINGKPVQGLFPVFVAKAEYEDRQAQREHGRSMSR